MYFSLIKITSVLGFALRSNKLKATEVCNNFQAPFARALCSPEFTLKRSNVMEADMLNMSY